MKTYKQLTEKRAEIWDTKPKTSKDAEDPEVFSQMKSQCVRALKEVHDWAKSGDFDIVENKMENINGMIEGIREIENEMAKPTWKRKITTLKRQGK